MLANHRLAAPHASVAAVHIKLHEDGYPHTPPMHHTHVHLACFSPQVGARMKQYEDELARKRLMAEHELQRQVCLRMRVMCVCVCGVCV